MLLTNTNETKLKFISKREYQKTPESRKITFVKLGDTNAYESFEFMADDSCNLELTTGQDVNVAFDVSNFNGRPSVRVNQLYATK